MILSRSALTLQVSTQGLFLRVCLTEVSALRNSRIHHESNVLKDCPRGPRRALSFDANLFSPPATPIPSSANRFSSCPSPADSEASFGNASISAELTRWKVPDTCLSNRPVHMQIAESRIAHPLDDESSAVSHCRDRPLHWSSTLHSYRGRR